MCLLIRYRDLYFLLLRLTMKNVLRRETQFDLGS